MIRLANSLTSPYLGGHGGLCGGYQHKNWKIWHGICSRERMAMVREAMALTSPYLPCVSGDPRWLFLNLK